MMEKNKSSGFGKWIFVIVVILLLAFISMIAAGIISIIIGVGSTSAPTRADKLSANVALVSIKGTILTESNRGVFGSDAIASSSEIISLLQDIKDSPNIKAVLFEINSPGGSGVAADEIASAIKSLNMTTASYIREMGTSAAYWTASATDHIVANRFSAVGSIGVIGSYLEFSGLLDDYNITYQKFIGGEHKDFPNPFVKPTIEQRQLFQDMIDSLHDVFIEEVALNRNMSSTEVKELAHGFIFTGMQGVENGLIDSVGGKKEAIMYIEKTENITAKVVEFKREVKFFEALGFSVNSLGFSIGNGIGNTLLRQHSQPEIMFR
jgi:protease IV